MKNIFLSMVAALLFSAVVNAQTTADSISAKYKMLPMPGAMTVEKTFPILGSYQLNTDSSTVTVTLDSVSKGIVWVEGLPIGKFKAYLKQSPAAYRILSQTTASGKQITEGTLLFDATTNTLNVAIGKAFDETDPSAIFAMNTVAAEVPSGSEVEVKVKTKDKKSKKESKSKSKITFYSATKAVAETNAVSSTQ
jgi:hypothetical protein